MCPLTSQLSGTRLRHSNRSYLIPAHRLVPTINEDDAACPLQRRLGACARNEGEFFGVTYRFHCKIDVQIWPVQVVRRWQFHSRDLANGGITEPRELFEGKKELFRS